ncbi:hypothetical protein Stube_16860 [Streptomyces tubercidicus]|uniref:Uncharacterized protein n=1 Tax=Streptomyces tubercidicus TaxID=47759 RepID=A0A640ULV6_9ACTN|nr:hypothetical protein Stube_16860 [Streptomyces tubercidicus]
MGGGENPGLRAAGKIQDPGAPASAAPPVRRPGPAAATSYAAPTGNRPLRHQARRPYLVLAIKYRNTLGIHTVPSAR